MYEDITSPKSLLYTRGGRRVGLSVKSRKAIQRRVRGPVKTDGRKIVQSKRNSDLLSFQLHFIINFVLTEPKLTHGRIKITALLSSHFVMNIIIAKPGSTAKVNSAK